MFRKINNVFRPNQPGQRGRDGGAGFRSEQDYHNACTVRLVRSTSMLVVGEKTQATVSSTLKRSKSTVSMESTLYYYQRQEDRIWLYSQNQNCLEYLEALVALRRQYTQSVSDMKRDDTKATVSSRKKPAPLPPKKETHQRFEGDIGSLQSTPKTAQREPQLQGASAFEEPPSKHQRCEECAGPARQRPQTRIICCKCGKSVYKSTHLFTASPMQIRKATPSAPPVPNEDDTLQFFDEVIKSCDSESQRKPYIDDGHADVDFIVASSSAEHDLHSNWVLRVPRVTDDSKQKEVPACANESFLNKKKTSVSRGSRLRLQRNPIHLPKVVESAFQTLRFKPKLKKKQ